MLDVHDNRLHRSGRDGDEKPLGKRRSEEQRDDHGRAKKRNDRGWGWIERVADNALKDNKDRLVECDEFPPPHAK